MDIKSRLFLALCQLIGFVFGAMVLPGFIALLSYRATGIIPEAYVSAFQPLVDMGRIDEWFKINCFMMGMSVSLLVLPIVVFISKPYAPHPPKLRRQRL